MAIIISNNADTPNLANNKLVYSVSSTNANEAQFRFVLDINDQTGTLLQRLKNQPAPDSSIAIFDIGQIVTNYLGPTDKVWTGTTDDTPNLNTNCGREFQIRFGEEWAASSTGIPAIYTGDSPDAAGNPNVSSSHYNYFIDGTKNDNDAANGFDWDWTTKYEEEDTYGIPTFNHQFGLTDFTTNKVRLDDYHTISILNGNVRGIKRADLDPQYAQDVYAMQIKEYDSSDTLLATNVYYNLSGLRSVSTELWDDVYQSQNYRTQLIHWPVGPANINAGAHPLNANTAYYVVTFHNQTAEPALNDNGIWSTHRFDIVDPECEFEGVRFAYKNEYGVWDYFNFDLAQSTNSDITRESYEQSFIDYGAGFAASYDPARRGVKQFQNRIEKRRTAESGYLTQTEADLLRELFYSTDVYVQNPNGSVLNGDMFLPVVITNASVTEKTNPRSQKLFRYTVEYKYANEIQPRV